ncbi:MAG: NERD domain-containing protein [Ruminococcaceae bacterium]|nr:NERD domain-containing protein [Oscillospiraceae bacterium]
MDTKTVYEQLTNVNIEQQKQIWDERGKGYYGEYLLFCELYRSVSGNSKILMNLNIPTDNSKTTEIDLILIHETGLYVFEIKHYKGTIYGKDSDAIWTQYFRTVQNSKFKNPINQNRYHILALKKLFPDMPMHSCIVFTNHDCDIRVANSNDEISVCTLSNINRTLKNRFLNSTSKYSMEDIDSIFVKLSAYSQMKEPVTINHTEADFFSWVQPTITKLEEKKDEVENLKSTWNNNIKQLKKTRIKGIIANIIVAILCVVLATAYCSSVIQKNNDILAEFKQNFLHIDEIDNKYIDALNSYVDVSNISLKPLTDDAVTFSARIAITNDIYGIALTENSKYIVITNSGKVFEYDVFGEHLRYSRIGNMIGKGIRGYGDLANVQFYGISNTEDISYIKITNIELFKLDVSRTIVKDKLEIELYSN